MILNPGAHHLVWDVYCGHTGRLVAVIESADVPLGPGYWRFVGRWVS